MLSGLIATGLDGLDPDVALPIAAEETAGVYDPASTEQRIEPLPRRLHDAVDALIDDDVVVDSFDGLRAEAQIHRAHITEWEHDRYLDDRVKHVLRSMSSRYSELLWVLTATVVGLTVPGPGQALVRHEAVNVVLAVLVFSAGLTVPRRVGTRLQQHGPRIVAVTAATSGAMIGIAWIVSHLVAAGPLRFGVIAVGVAPVEIATLGVAPLGGGDSLTSGVMLIVSTLLAAIIAGPTVALLAGGAYVDLGSVIVTLVVVVVVPFAIGLGIREGLSQRARSGVNDGHRGGDDPRLAGGPQAYSSDAYVGVVVAPGS